MRWARQLQIAHHETRDAGSPGTAAEERVVIVAHRRPPRRWEGYAVATLAEIAGQKFRLVRLEIIPEDNLAVWAMVSVTNNTTQPVTGIYPNE
jgi:hypothetical protein